jgi:hypothetical protein
MLRERLTRGAAKLPASFDEVQAVVQAEPGRVIRQLGGRLQQVLRPLPARDSSRTTCTANADKLLA